MADMSRQVDTDNDNKEVKKENEEKTCFMCGRLATLACSGCGEVWFCCAEHGKLHFREEEGNCFPWKVAEKDGVGRILVTTRSVRAGETLFMEEPLVHGPNQDGWGDSQHSPACLSCYSPVTMDYLCPGCGYPMCGEECAGHPHHQEECSVLSAGHKPVCGSTVTEAYHCILPLRMLLLARSDPDRFNLTDHLMDHEEERKGDKDWLITERTVVQKLMQICDAEVMRDLTAADIRRAIGVLEVNSFEVSDELRGCFPISSLLSHSCVPNSCHIWTLDAPYTNTCIAAVDLQAGQELLTTYQIPSTCSLRRRPNLKTGWYFDCTCERCSSLSELGTNMNTLVCPGCKKPSMLPQNPLQSGSVWRCFCGHKVSEKVAISVVANIIKDTNNVIKKQKHNVNAWLKLEKSALKLVHPQHEVMLEIAKWMLPILCRGPNQPTSKFPPSKVQKKLDLAKRYFSVLSVVEPGYSKPRVKALYEIIETELFLMFFKVPKIGGMKDNLIKKMDQLNMVIEVLERLGTNKGFETILVHASKNILVRIEDILSQMEKNSLNLNEWREGWSLIELWKGAEN